MTIDIGDADGGDDFNPPTILVCRGCDRTETLAAGSADHEWMHVTGPGVMGADDDGFRVGATCPECIATVRDSLMQQAHEGRIICLHPDHSYHVPDTDALEDCRADGYLPLSDTESADAAEAYHAVRGRVCPRCGIEELTAATVQYQGLALDGLKCECGWIGRRPEAAYRRTADKPKDGETP